LKFKLTNQKSADMNNTIKQTSCWLNIYAIKLLQKSTTKKHKQYTVSNTAFHPRRDTIIY